MTEGQLHPWGCSQRMELGRHFWSPGGEIEETLPPQGWLSTEIGIRKRSRVSEYLHPGGMS